MPTLTTSPNHGVAPVIEVSAINEKIDRFQTAHTLAPDFAATEPLLPQDFKVLSENIGEQFLPYLPQSTLLQSSPYSDNEHLLDLTTLETPVQALAKALGYMREVRSDFVTAPYKDSFNWDAVIASVREIAQTSGFTFKQTSFLIIVFRSRVPPSTVDNYDILGALDKSAHAEANASGGFIKYWFGAKPDANNRNLATCIWRSPEDAKRGTRGPAHAKAAGITRQMYSEWKIERLRLTITDNAATWDMTDWDAKVAK